MQVQVQDGLTKSRCKNNLATKVLKSNVHYYNDSTFELLPQQGEWEHPGPTWPLTLVMKVEKLNRKKNKTKNSLRAKEMA